MYAIHCMVTALLYGVGSTDPVVSVPCAEVPEPGKTAMLLGMSQWNSNDLVEQIETLGHMDPTQGRRILSV